MKWRKVLVLVFLCVIVWISMFVHELGHIVIGSLLDFNYKGLTIGPYFLFIAIRFDGTYPVFDTFLFVRLAGGVFQAIFFLFMARVWPDMGLEFKVVAMLCFIYAIIEGMVVGL